MLQKTAEYALRATVWLAQEPGRAHASDQIARAIRVPRRYVHKVLQALVRAGIVRSQPGPHGGYSLKSAADKTTILDVITAVGPLQRIRRCPLGLESHTDLCPLHRELDDAFAAMEQAFTRVTVADVVNRPSPITPLREVIASGMPALTTPVSPDCRDSGMPPNRE
jgi:Rrf2 family transcriptional regulator, nitric oxide-sensitive transcriptional repressor